MLSVLLALGSGAGLAGAAGSSPSTVDEYFAKAAERAQVDADVSFVQMGGFWEHEQRGGRYRLLAISVGWEERSDIVFLQWVQYPLEYGPAELRASTLLKELSTGFFSVEAATFERRGDGWRLNIETHNNYPQHGCLVLVVGPPGQYEVVSKESAPIGADGRARGSVACPPDAASQEGTE